MLGIFNVCRNVCPGLDIVVKPLQLALNDSKLPSSEEL